MDTAENFEVAQEGVQAPIQEETIKTKRKYTKRKPTEHKQTENVQPEMKLFSVYVANGWNRVDGTLIAETKDVVKNRALKMLNLGEEEQDGVTVLINEIKTGIHLVQ